ncbi:UDP-N-acetylglucosamine 2-epimerase (non-hydrolyzing) [bacterium]|nr:UDP-N-acetylglucosamine 2-epimerase (non-hydrolyzing) [bacterium]
MLKVINIVGARPQFLKYFPVSTAIQKYNRENEKNIRDVLIHTGQHYDYDMSRVFFNELGIRKPDHHLEVGSAAQGEQTAGILMKTEAVLQKEEPDCVVVYGDTNSTLGGALAAAKLNIPVAHVEAGLRSYNRRMPEEINRICTDRISSLLFCPCQAAVDLLKREGFTTQNTRNSEIDLSGQTALFTGDVMYDLFLGACNVAQSKPSVLESLNLETGQYSLFTCHRAENTNDIGRFKNIVKFVNQMAEETPVVFPVHPRVKKRLEKELRAFTSNVRQIEPVSYFQLLQLLTSSQYVMTDSGGLQKEALWAEKPCITLRDETEWIETIDAGWNVLWHKYTGLDAFRKEKVQPYGDGKAADKIVEILCRT